ncbi:MAG: hypothetical protein HUK20_14710, partial [Fibrobacter sp.]|nr:hypothetical protein [Fibrobacter sp.]
HMVWRNFFQRRKEPSNNFRTDERVDVLLSDAGYAVELTVGECIVRMAVAGSFVNIG